MLEVAPPPIDIPVSAPIVAIAASGVTQARQIAISEGLISLVDATITPEVATAFHRPMLRSVHRVDPAHTAISGAALHKLDITIKSDGAQTFIPPSFFPHWTHRITCAKLSEIVLHYFGPRINTIQTIEQAFKATPFIYDILLTRRTSKTPIVKWPTFSSCTYKRRPTHCGT